MLPGFIPSGAGAHCRIQKVRPYGQYRTWNEPGEDRLPAIDAMRQRGSTFVDRIDVQPTMKAKRTVR